MFWQDVIAEVFVVVITVISLIFISICLQAVRGLLDNPNEPINELSYFDCIESVMENSKVQPFKTILQLSKVFDREGRC